MIAIIVSSTGVCPGKEKSSFILHPTYNYESQYILLKHQLYALFVKTACP